MKKLFILPFLLFLLTSCSSTHVDVNNNLYSDGKEIIQFTVSNIHSKQMDYSNKQNVKVDEFQTKYKNLKKTDKDYEYYQLVENVITNYKNYSNSLNKLKTKFNITID